jgi:hypothetical protein
LASDRPDALKFLERHNFSFRSVMVDDRIFAGGEVETRRRRIAAFENLRTRAEVLF